MAAWRIWGWHKTKDHYDDLALMLIIRSVCSVCSRIWGWYKTKDHNDGSGHYADNQPRGYGIGTKQEPWMMLIIRSVCSCTCTTCHPYFFSRDAQGRWRRKNGVFWSGFKLGFALLTCPLAILSALACTIISEMLIMYSDRDSGGLVIEKTSTMTIVISLKGDRSAPKTDLLVF